MNGSRRRVGGAICRCGFGGQRLRRSGAPGGNDQVVGGGWVEGGAVVAAPLGFDGQSGAGAPGGKFLAGDRVEDAAVGVLSPGAGIVPERDIGDLDLRAGEGFASRGARVCRWLRRRRRAFTRE